MIKILTPYLKDKFSLKNHLVIAPMTRSRAIGNLPNNLMAEYYGQRTLDVIRSNFKGTIILSSGLTPETAENALNNGIADLVAFGRSFLANPDFEKRIEKPAPLNQVDFKTLYTADAVGYTDYPTLK
jgi:2,4-dienoyl-CoA reductase-like NADH-dependent reductase (Old Yellow Enzyme family)